MFGYTGNHFVKGGSHCWNQLFSSTALMKYIDPEEWFWTILVQDWHKAQELFLGNVSAIMK
jgi:hypothetical protein